MANRPTTHRAVSVHVPRKIATAPVAVSGHISYMDEQRQCEQIYVGCGDVVRALARALAGVMPALDADVHFTFRHAPAYGYDFDTRDAQVGYIRIERKTGLSRSQITDMILDISTAFSTPDQ